MSVRAGKVIKCPVDARPVALPEPVLSRRQAGARTVGREVVDLHVEARRAVEKARQEAAQVMREAQEAREQLFARTKKEALDTATAQLGASWIALRNRESAADRGSLERSIALARLLAERLIGEQLRVNPDAIVTLAAEAMRQLWRADKVVVMAHPSDAARLRAHLDALPVAPEVVQVVDDPERPSGKLRIESSLGRLDAELGPQLDRLVEALRKQLLPG